MPILKILVTGMTGFIGRYLAEALVKQGHEVVGTAFLPHERVLSSPVLKDVRVVLVDVRDQPMVEGLVASVRPDVVYHLAGQAYVIPSYRDTKLTFDVNVLGTVHLLEAIKLICPQASVGVACSGAEYGWPKSLPIREDHPLEPLSPYGVSKAAQDMVACQYHANYGLRTYRMRLFSTTGAGKVGDAPNDFASQIAQAESNGHGFVKVGNIATSRDISNVRDTVRAMQTIVERGEPGEAYNIGRGAPVSIKGILDKLLALSTAAVEVVTEAERIRPSDEPTLYPDISRIQKLGWTPQISLDQTLAELLDFWRHDSEKLFAVATAK
jgi:GDP-4-dehydro-6-deoxy-D-mannose reductase